MRTNLWSAVVVAAVLLTACGGEAGPDTAATTPDDASVAPSATATPTPTATATPTDAASATPTPTATTATPDPTPTADPEAAPPVDLVDYGSGAFPLRIDGDSRKSEMSRALLDGIPGYVGIPVGDDAPGAPVQLVVELPAPTTFDTFAVPPMSSFGCCDGTHADRLTIEGSAVGPDDGYEELASFRVAREAYEEDQEFPATSDAEVRWLRITAEGRQVPDPDGRFALVDLKGYGDQQPREFIEDEFTGIFLTGGGGSGPDGNRIEMQQDGALVRGCRIAGGAFAEFTGGIENGILKVLAGDGVPSLYVISSEGQFLGVEVGRSYGRTIGDPGGNPTTCFQPPAEGDTGEGQETESGNPVTQAIDACETEVVYGVNFDVDSDQLRPDADGALQQILDALTERPDATVTIEGHTDSDGSDDYNLDLSDRRAAAVVTWLTDRGIDAGRMTAVGKGEAEPIADNETTAGKAANRRTEVEPTC